MTKSGLIVTFKAVEGKRDEIRKVWEKYMKPKAENGEDVEISCYTYDSEDKDVIHLFEILAGDHVLGDAMQQDFFMAYMKELEPLLAGPPVVRTIEPIWIKGQ